ncbi:hypothetical protein DPMN_135244 [Dreissena polymorpha]|uniref:Uncharacterized protein n=1 Tax=Dreissena polymorpha TaxID=45954 RepID=A0A9D4JCN3_DREPO|nr:hypothetical protein DPMN_135244 [Dreissena polymorpha]
MTASCEIWMIHNVASIPPEQPAYSRSLVRSYLVTILSCNISWSIQQTGQLLARLHGCDGWASTKLNAFGVKSIFS